MRVTLTEARGLIAKGESIYHYRLDGRGRVVEKMPVVCIEKAGRNRKLTILGGRSFQVPTTHVLYREELHA
jgi:hypothetical protein